MKDIQKFIKNDDFQATPEGVLIHGSILATGRYVHSVNGKDERIDTNLVPAEGILHILGVVLKDVSRVTAWFLTIFSGNVSPVSTWTAANFTANSTEITSTSEGWTGATRVAWVPGAAAAGVIGNLSSKAVFPIVCTTSVSIAGAGLLSSNTRGGTSGTLVSASRFGSVRTVYDHDSFELGYEVELQDS